MERYRYGVDQVRKLLMEYQKSGEVGMAGLKAGMHRETAGKYLAGGLLPSQRRDVRLAQRQAVAGRATACLPRKERGAGRFPHQRYAAM